MDSPTVPRPSAAALLRRLYGGVSREGLVAAVGLVVVFSFGRSLWDMFDEIRDVGALPAVAGMLIDLLGQLLTAAAMILLIAPVLHLGPPHGSRRALALAAALVVAAIVAAVVRIVYMHWLQPADGDPSIRRMLHQVLLRYAVRYGYLAALFVFATELHRRALRSLSELHRAERDRLALERETAAAQLQVLQAQIEPHFLFNSLANVRRLYQTDATAGRDMLDNLMRYLETALPRMRDETSTLERERSLIGAFLNVQKIRMGRRLSFEIDMPTELEAREVPPMMLMTLVENALKHGLGPLPEGGMVRVEARHDGGELVLRVADSGVGFGSSVSGAGTGLANIRSRLDAMFGDRATLELSSNLPRGVTATLRLPLATEAA